MVDLLLGQPVVTVNAVAQCLNLSFPAVNTAIAELTALYTRLDDVLQAVERQTRLDEPPAGEDAASSPRTRHR